MADSISRVSLRQRMGLWFESQFMARLIPRDGLPRGLRWVFRTPLFFQRHGLGFLIPRNILILTTTGRRSGRLHQTPLEFGPGPRPGSLMLMAGWEGHTDWYRNALVQPRVHVWQRGREWDAMAEPLPLPDVAEMLRAMAKIAPASNLIWSRWSGVKMDGSDASYLAAAPHFPSLYLVPVFAETQHAPVDADVEGARRVALELLDQARAHTRSVFSHVNPDTPVHQDAHAWRARDVLSHLAAWNAEAARSLEAYADGGEYICVESRLECDGYNEIAAQERSPWALVDVWAEYEAAHDAFRAAVERMPAGKWSGEMLYPWNERGTVEKLVKRMMKHETADHCDPIEQVLA